MAMISGAKIHFCTPAEYGIISPRRRNKMGDLLNSEGWRIVIHKCKAPVNLMATDAHKRKGLMVRIK